MGKRMTTEQMEKILSVHFLEGKNLTETGAACAVSSSSAAAVVTAFKMVRADDYETLAKSIVPNGNYTRSVVEFAFAKTGKKIPEIIDAAFDIRDAKTKERDRAKKNPTPEPAKPIPVKKAEITDEQANETVFFTRILQEMMRLNENLEQFMDVVIPKYCGDMKDCINANMDSMHNEVKACEQRLEKIQYNSRKSGM
ncbi:MAG: hypothetical protein Q3984_03555 [Eubacteriales bacterium]|nr:hypothetical protein [Eubacteriales bacterium]